MTRIRFFRAGLVALLLASAGLALATMGCRETFVSRYASLEEAKRDGAIERGWVPAVLPASATDIREAHNVDTNETCLAFTLPSDAIDAWASERVESLPDGSDRPRRPSASWCHEISEWSRFERAVLDGRQTTMVIARLKGEDPRLVGLDRTSGRVFLWRP